MWFFSELDSNAAKPYLVCQWEHLDANAAQLYLAGLWNYLGWVHWSSIKALSIVWVLASPAA